MNTNEKIISRLAALRALMKQHRLAAYIVPGADPHASEYMAPHWMEMSWLTGFLGETGTAVVTMDEAFLWTDSRYYLQAQTELSGSTIALMRASDVDCPSLAQWLVAHLASPMAVGVNPEMYSVNAFGALRTDLADGGLELVSVDLIKPLWVDNRPDIPLHPLYVYDECYAGESADSKLARLGEAMQAKRCDVLVIAELDEIGWLLNVRGTDVDYTPCVIAYCVVEKERCTLFIDPRKLPSPLPVLTSRMPVIFRPYDEVFTYLNSITGTGVLFDGDRVNEALYEAINPAISRRVNAAPSPLQVMMSEKNDVELSGERQAMREDAVALTRFFKWLDEEALLTPQTEITLADKLHAFRAMGKHFTDESFATIAGWNGNGAIVHYHAEPDTCAEIKGEGVLLLDSGGQYLDGTTDITRTVWVGQPAHIPAELKRDFTLVMKGHIALARARFPKGTRGNQLDVLAHQYMWQDGVTYGHGTGHGVGHFMGCHEGPANIRTDNNPNPIRLGNVFSDEPGIYRAGQWGIRTENLMATVPAPPTERSTGETYYAFETLTLCFYDTRLLDLSMLTPDEIDWINRYHQWVYNEIAPLLNDNEAAYLREKTKELSD